MSEFDSGVHPSRAGRQRWLRPGLGASIAGVLLAVACSGEAATPSTSVERDSSSTTTPASTGSSTTISPTSSAADSIEDEIIARYVGFWEARLAANSGEPNPEDPALREFATGQQLETIIDETRQRGVDGLALREAEPSRTDHSVTVISVTADRAELQDCFINDGVVYRVHSGEVVDDSVVTRSVSAVMVRVDGVWRLERATVLQEWEGVAGCALAG